MRTRIRVNQQVGLPQSGLATTLTVASDRRKDRPDFKISECEPVRILDFGPIREKIWEVARQPIVSSFIRAFDACLLYDL